MDESVMNRDSRQHVLRTLPPAAAFAVRSHPPSRNRCHATGSRIESTERPPHIAIDCAIDISFVHRIEL
jgi:hypothetical protein